MNFVNIFSANQVVHNLVDGIKLNIVNLSSFESETSHFVPDTPPCVRQHNTTTHNTTAVLVLLDPLSQTNINTTQVS